MKNCRIILPLMIACLLITACSVDKQIGIEPNSFHNHILPETNLLLQEIKKVQYNDLNTMKQIAKKLSLQTGDSIGSNIGRYYWTKANFYSGSTDSIIHELNTFYPFFSRHGLTELQLDLDFLLFRYYYSEQRLEEASERMELMFNYIFEPEFDLQRATLLYGETPSFPGIDYQEKVTDIDHYIASLNPHEWTPYHVEIWLGYAQANYKLGNKGETKRILEEAIERSRNANLLFFTARLEHRLANYLHSDDLDFAIERSKNAIATLDKTGYQLQKNYYLRFLGLLYFTKKNYSEAFNQFTNSIEYGNQIQDNESLAMDNVYAAWAIFKVSSTSNVETAHTYFNQAEKMCSKKSIVYKLLLERKLWMNEHLKNTKEAQRLREELAKFIINNPNSLADSQKEFKVYNLITLKSKDDKIRKLELSNQLQTTKINKSRYVKWLTVVSFLLIVGIMHVLIKQKQLVKELTFHESEHKKANEHLIKQNQLINRQNKLLEVKQNELAFELKNKLNLLTDNVRILDKIKNEVTSDDQIPSQSKHQLLSLIKSKENKRIIGDLDDQFIEMNKEFFQKLTQLHPELTNNNLKLCLYLKMNLSTKEIASLTYSTSESIKVARSRLRRKLDLDNRKASLTSYLNSI